MEAIGTSTWEYQGLDHLLHLLHAKILTTSSQFPMVLYSWGQAETTFPRLILHGPDKPSTWSYTLLGGSWAVISGVISRVTILTTHIRGLITLLITTHEPPSKPRPHTLNPDTRKPKLETLEP